MSGKLERMSKNLKDCTCIENKNPKDECQDKYTICERGQCIKLKPKNTKEIVQTIIVDGCLADNKKSKCDCLFLYTNTKKEIYSYLVELKHNDWPKPAFQIDSFRKSEIYKSITSKVHKQFYIIVGSFRITKPSKEQIEDELGIRLKIINRQNNEKIPDLREDCV